MTRAGSESVILGLALLGHAASAAVFAIDEPALGLPRSWDLQFYALVAASLAAAALARAWRGSTRSKAAIAAELLFYLLACYPLPPSSGIQELLGLPLMLGIVASFPRPDYFLVGAAALVGALLLERPAVAWGRAAHGGDPASLILLGAVLASAFALGSAIKELAEGRRKSMLEAARLDTAIDSIADVNASFQAALAAAEAVSVKKERNRITREIHDIVGYALTNQQMMLEACLMLAEPGGGRLRELLSMAKDGVAEGLRETRKTLYELRRIDEAPDLGFGGLLTVARNFERVTGIRVSVDFTNSTGQIEHSGWLSVYRLIQESMINSFRHGHARNIAITFREDGSALHVQVRDDGRGASELIEGIGIKGMRERLEALGGELEVGNAVDGFAVSASIPLAPKGNGGKP